MEVSFSNAGINTGIFTQGFKVENQNSNAENRVSAHSEAKKSDFRAEDVDVLRGSEPLSDVPDVELVRDDALGRLVSSAFCLQPPPMPNFNA